MNNEILVGNIKHDIPFGYTGIYIGRAGHGISGLYGNPFGRKAKFPFRVATKEIAIFKFREMLFSPIGAPFQYNELTKRYKNNEKLFLQCFCKKEIGDDIPCHGDIIKEFLEKRN